MSRDFPVSFARSGVCLAAAIGLVATGIVGAGSAATASQDTATASNDAASQDAGSTGIVDAASGPEQRGSNVAIRGKVVGGGGMTLIALQSNGRVTARKLGANGAFNLSTVGRGTTLHLVDASGTYRGPVVLRGNGKKGKIAKSSLVYSQVKKKSGKINVGKIRLGVGYGLAKKPVAAKLVITSTAASSVARKGQPIGAANLGRVEVGSNNLLASPIRPGLDNDRDGLPSAFDVDDNGNLILDNVDRTNRAGSIRAGESGDISEQGVRIFSNYKSTSPNFSDVINVNVKVPTGAELNNSVNAKTGLAVQVVPGATLTCAGQVYCPATPISLVAGPTGDYQWQLASTYPSLGAADVAAGDTFVETVGGLNYAGVLNFVFQTTPALKGYSILDAGGNVTFTESVDWTSGNKAGSAANPIRVGVASGEKVRLEFWRPQRPAIGGEANTSGFVDIGGLTYKADDSPGFCAATAADADGQTVADGGSTAVLDKSADGVPSASRTLSMDVDLNTCVGSDIDIQAVSLYGDNSAQKVFFSRVSECIFEEAGRPVGAAAC